MTELTKEEHTLLKKNILITSIDAVYNWAKKYSLWPLTFATACCAIEMICTSASRFDIARFGSEVFRASPRQADLMITAGTITKRMAPALVTLFHQMPEPKWVIAMGNCTINGGIFRTSPTVVQGVDKIIPVDIYLPGCPPAPEALLNAIIQLRKEIEKESVLTIKERVRRWPKTATSLKT